MIFDPRLMEATLVRRYKRFLCDVIWPDGREATAHCPNSGAMMGVAPSGASCWLSQSDNPKRKHALTLEMVAVDGAPVGVNTQAPNRLVAEALETGSIAELTGYRQVRREVRYGTASRIDFLLEDPARPPAYVEVKNVHLRRTGRLAEFPDCVTARGAKHLRELADMAQAGARAVQLFVIQRNDCDAFALAKDIDPAYAAAFHQACVAGVEALAYGCAVSPDAITLDRPIPIHPARW